MQQHLRLRRSQDFQRLRQIGQTRAHPLTVLSFAANDLPHNRYGIVTTRKLGGAVQRNRAKRRLREALRHWHPALAPGHDIVLIARRDVLTCPYADLLAAVEQVLRRAGLLLR